MKDAGILDGDVVIAKQTSTGSIGDIVVALVEDETTVKYLYLADNQWELRPANSKYKSQFYELDTLYIQGVVVALHRAY
jgi:repressor LexA